MGSRGQRARQHLPRQRRDPGAPRPERAHRPQHPHPPRVRRVDPRDARRRDARWSEVAPHPAAPEVPRLGPRARRGVGRVARAERGRGDRSPRRPRARAAARGPEVQASRPGLEQGAAGLGPRRPRGDDGGGRLAAGPGRLDARPAQACSRGLPPVTRATADDVQREHEAHAWGWVAHLRDGGTTPWSAWSTSASADEQSGRYLPGAQQLELLRQLNQLRLPSPQLAERVLGASAPGRARPDLGLVGVLPESAFGPPPVDPAGLPADELVRVATALIAEDVVAAGDPLEPRTPRLLRRRYRLLGDPGVTAWLRDLLLAAGRPPGGRSATVVVTGTDLPTMLANVWAARSVGAGVRPWPEWLAAVIRRRRLPDRIDLPALAEAW